MARQVDVAVVGGGPAGTACAAILAGHGLRVVLLTGGSHRRGWPDLLSPAVADALDRLGFPPEELAAVARPCRGIVDRWQAGDPGHTDFELLHFRPGWVVDRGAFDERLVRHAASRGVEVSHVPSARWVAGSPRRLDRTLTLRGEGVADQWSADFVVDATGAAGRLLPQGENGRIRYDRLVAVRVNLSAGPTPTDWMHLAPSTSGWWYTLTPAAGPTQAVFMTDGDLLPRSAAARRRHLAAEFRLAFPESRQVELSEPTATRDARTSCRRKVWSGRWLPIGDARASVDPITGAGLQRALASATETAALVVDVMTTGSFQGLEASALGFLVEFQVLLAELPRRYALASSDSQALDGPFWQRRSERWPK